MSPVNPWEVWEVRSGKIAPVAICVGYSPQGRPMFAGIRTERGVNFLEVVEAKGIRDIEGYPAEVTPVELLGRIPSDIPKWTHRTLCNSCGKTAVYLEISEKWICRGPCVEAHPITLESSQMREYLEELLDMLKDEVGP